MSSRPWHRPGYYGHETRENCTRWTYKRQETITRHIVLRSYNEFASHPNLPWWRTASCRLSALHPGHCVWHIRTLSTRHVTMTWDNLTRFYNFSDLTAGLRQTDYVQQILCSASQMFVTDVQHYSFSKTLLGLLQATCLSNEVVTETLYSFMQGLRSYGHRTFGVTTDVSAPWFLWLTSCCSQQLDIQRRSGHGVIQVLSRHLLVEQKITTKTYFQDSRYNTFDYESTVSPLPPNPLGPAFRRESGQFPSAGWTS
jgi:hypothetical protein